MASLGDKGHPVAAMEAIKAADAVAGRWHGWEASSVADMTAALTGTTVALAEEVGEGLVLVLTDGSAWKVAIDMGFASADLGAYRWTPA